MVLTYVITLGGIAIEIAGYPALSFYWFLSWVRSLMILFWALVLFNVIVEWKVIVSRKTPGSFTPVATDYPVRRMFISISWLLWTAGLVTGLILAWNTQPNIQVRIFTSIFNQSFAIGNVNVNIINILLAGFNSIFKL